METIAETWYYMFHKNMHSDIYDNIKDYSDYYNELWC